MSTLPTKCFLGLALMLTLSACADSAQPLPRQNNSNKQPVLNNQNNTPAPDMDDVEDMSSDLYADMLEDMSNPPPDMNGDPAPYSYDLIDLGPISTSCDTTVQEMGTSPNAPKTIPESSAPGKDARLFVPSIALNANALKTHMNWRMLVHRMIHDHVAPCIKADANNVVALPESSAMLTLLVGDKANQARAQRSAAGALAAISYTLDSSAKYYQTRYPELTLAQSMLLASTDAMGHIMMDTYAQLARQYNVWILAPYYGAPFQWSTEPAAIEALSDPDIQDTKGVYVATSPEVALRHVVIDPSGAIVSIFKKQRYNDAEALLALPNGQLDDLNPVKIEGLGRVAWTAGSEGVDPDIRGRLEDLGATTLIQGSAQRKWTDNSDGRWTPDEHLFRAWHPIQYGVYAHRAVSPQMQGEVIALELGSQSYAVEPAGLATGPSKFIGQFNELYGMSWIDSWVFPNEMWLELPTELLRDLLDELPVSAFEQTTTMRAFDVHTQDTISRQQHPRALDTPEGLRVIHVEGELGARALVLNTLEQGQLKRQSVLSLPDMDLLHPEMVLGSDGVLHIVAEGLPHQPNQPNQLIYSKVDLSTGMVRHIGPLTSLTTHSVYRPHLINRGDTLHLAWVESSGTTQRAVYTQVSTLTGSKSNISSTPFASAVVKPLGAPSQPAHHWGVRLAVSGRALVATWLQRNATGWEIEMSASIDAGLSWSDTVTNTRAVSGHAEHLTIQSTSDDDRFVLSWTTPSLNAPSTTIAAQQVMVMPRGNINASIIHRLPNPKGWYAQPAWTEDGKQLYYSAIEAQSIHIQSARFDDVLGLQPLSLRSPITNREGKVALTVPQVNGQATYLLYTSRQPDTSKASVTLKLVR